jgi:hypothetical protein
MKDQNPKINHKSQNIDKEEKLTKSNLSLVEFEIIESDNSKMTEF